MNSMAREIERNLYRITVDDSASEYMELQRGPSMSNWTIIARAVEFVEEKFPRREIMSVELHLESNLVRITTERISCSWCEDTLSEVDENLCATCSNSWTL